MNNAEFLQVIKNSFATYLSVGTSRSTAKLKTLHGCIAEDVQHILGEEFVIQSQGFGEDREGSIEGRYYSKNVDITVSHKGKAVAGYAIKFVMRNYLQNSNNYFESMLGETANIRSNNVPYFQVLILFDKLPYYKNGGEFKKYDIITPHNIEKYLALSKDDPLSYRHTPDKTLFVLLHLKEGDSTVVFKDQDEYAEFYQKMIQDDDLLSYSKNQR